MKGPALSVALLSLAGTAWATHAQSPAAPIPPPAAPASATAPEPFDPAIWQGRPGVFVGTRGCTNGLCHGASGAQERGDIRGDEHTVWLADPHRDAARALDTVAAAAMSRALGLGPPQAAQLCLDCHSISAPENLRDGLSPASGISCEGCHGPAGGWVARHMEPAWPRERSLALGMVDLRDLAVRTQQCARCHVGSGRRAVDHRLIAAGHPVLRFELDNYTASLPRHWRLGGVRRDGSPRAAEHGVRAWAVAQASTFAAALGVMAAQAAGPGPWPEFSQLSCRSCHHDLKAGRWRTQAGYVYRGGQPPWSPARWLALAVLSAEIDPRLATSIADRVEVLATRLRAFAPRTEVTEAARALVPDLQDLAARMAASDWPSSRVRRLIRALAADRERLLAADVASAEQVYWGLRTLVAELTASGVEPVDGALTRALDAVYRDLADPDTVDRSALGRHLEALENVAR